MSIVIQRELGLLAVFAALSASCTPGGGETSGIDGTGVRTPVTASAYGRMTGFSSFTVNGVTYDTANATVIIDGAPGRFVDIAPNDIVSVAGSVDSPTAATGVAQKVILDHAVVGPVASIDTAAGSIVALGQTVRLADATFDTSINGASVAGLAVGDLVEVSGFRGQRSEVIASRIAKRAPGTPGFRAVGRISKLDTASKRLEINALTVDYASALLDTGESGALAVNTVVEVSGTEIGPSGALIAERVVRKPTDVIVNPGSYVNLEGFVTALNAADPERFEVAGLPIMTTSTTTKDGALAFDTVTEVKGLLSSNGTLVASNVRTGLFVPPGTHTLQGLVYDANRGPVPGVPINIGVQTPEGSFNWWYVTGRAYSTDSSGRFEIKELPNSQVELWVGGFTRGYVQPCGVRVDVSGDTTRDIEVVSTETLNTAGPLRPITARDPTLTGTVYKLTANGRQPVAGVTVVADGAHGLGWVLADTLTDSNGRYFLCDLRPGMDLQVFEPPSLDPLKEIYPVGGPPSRTLDIEIEAK